MYCNKCGYEVEDNSNFCPNCGNTLNTNVVNNTSNKNEEDGRLLSILAVVFSVVMPIVGLIMALVCKNQYKDPDTLSKFKIAQTISIILISIYVVIVIIFLTFFFLQYSTIRNVVGLM